MSDIAVAVEQGKQVVNALFLKKETDTVVVIHGDMETKYAEVRCYSSGDGIEEIVLGSNEYTLHEDATADQDTVIKISNLPTPHGGFWQVETFINRYTIMIFCVYWPQGADAGANYVLLYDRDDDDDSNDDNDEDLPSVEE